MSRTSILQGTNEKKAAETLLELYTQLQQIGAAGRKRVYDRWEHLHLIPAGDGDRWEREVRRVTKNR